jgi:transmembrane 9 superfamily protein 2/4
LGRRSKLIRFPTQVNEAARDIPSWKARDWFWAVLYIVICGPYTFGSIFVEYYYLLASAWMEYYYNTFFYVSLVLLVAVITCSVTAVLFTYYFVLRKENYNWWWRSFSFGCLTGLLSFAYSFLFFRSIGASGTSAILVYFGYMSVTSLALALALGFVALSANIWFSQRLYGIFEEESSADDDQIIEMSRTDISPQPATGEATTTIPIENVETPIS